jgi:hypothetical protein
MTENTEPQVEPEVEQEVETEKPAADTAFLMIKDWDGIWKATTDLSMALIIDRRASRNDVKTGCRDIYEFLNNSDLATAVVSKISAQNLSDTERAAQSVRQALSDRETS